MKKILTISLLLIGTFAQAQYFQHWYNKSFVLANMDNESFYDGIRTQFNYSGGNPLTWFNVGYGATYITPVGAFVTSDARFVRTAKSGAPVNINHGTHFANSGTILWHNSFGKAICEINNGVGTGGYLAVGNVESNSITGSVVPGGSDGLFYKMNNAGTPSARYRFDLSGRADYFTDIISSKVNPGIYYVCGYSSTSTNEECIVMSILSNGTVNWFRRYQFDPTWAPGSPATARCRAYGIAEDINTGNLIVVGSFEDQIVPTVSGIDGLVFYLTPAGAVICAQSHDVFIDDQYQDVVQTNNGGFAICGFAGDGPPPPPGAFYHLWLTEMSATCGVVTSTVYTHGYLGALHESRGYALIERKNVNNTYEYFIAGPDRDPGSGLIKSSINKINAGGAPVAWYDYAAQSGIANDGYGIDYSPAAATKPGVLLFSNTNSPAATSPFDDSYMIRTYFNGATCTSYCPNNSLIASTPPLLIANLPDSIKNTFNKKQLTSQTTNYVFGVICTQNAIGCGSNAREELNEIVLEIPAENNMNIYPNPAADILNISINNSEEGFYTIEAIDITGRLTELSNEYLNKGEQVVQVDVSNMAKGMYTIILRNGNHVMTNKFVVQ